MLYMNKNDILNRLALAINTLDALSVSGRQNRNALSGSIGLLEEIGVALNDIDFVDTNQEVAESDD